jgi:hypothetical protein
MRSQTKKKLRQMWGYVVLGIVAVGWFGLGMGPGVIAGLSGVVVLYTLFQAPMWCCAETRGGNPCRNNSYGILLGCHVRQHKWQKMAMAFHVSSWKQLMKRVWSSIGGASASVSALAAVASVVVALAALAKQ